MTQEGKQLLLQDLCARLPYGVKVAYLFWDENKCEEYIVPMEIYSINSDGYMGLIGDVDEGGGLVGIDKYLPYLRPMSSMTKEESKEYFSICTGSIRDDMIAKIDFYIKHHFDFRLTSEGLSMIEAGLALEAPNGMYDLEKK